MRFDSTLATRQSTIVGEGRKKTTFFAKSGYGCENKREELLPEVRLRVCREPGQENPQFFDALYEQCVYCKTDG